MLSAFWYCDTIWAGTVLQWLALSPHSRFESTGWLAGVFFAWSSFACVVFLSQSKDLLVSIVGDSNLPIMCMYNQCSWLYVYMCHPCNAVHWQPNKWVWIMDGWRVVRCFFLSVIISLCDEIMFTSCGLYLKWTRCHQFIFIISTLRTRWGQCF